MELTRGTLVKAGGAAAAAAVLALGLLAVPAQSVSPVAETPAAPWNHDPGSEIGPDDWGQIGYPICSQGTQQSPVDIATGVVATVGGPPLLLRYEDFELEVENTGHVVEVPIPAGVHNTLRIGGDVYELSQFHFHAPSEHAIDGVQADVEAHFVHVNALGDIAVVGVLYRVGPHPNEVLDRILSAAPEVAGEDAPVGEANPAELLAGIGGIALKHRGPAKVDSFYSYDGSLTTPACTEHVRWSVLMDGGQVSADEVAHLHDVIAHFPGYAGYPDNNRPLQPLNGRVVTSPR
jgi:carbonic anhydrase